MRCQLVWVAHGTLLAVALPVATAQVESKRDPESRGAIRKWVGDLGHPSYKTREHATRQLLSSGSAAVELLVPATASDNLEAATRAARILTQLVNSDDEDFEVLQRVIDTHAGPVPPRATRIATAVHRRRVEAQREAVAALRPLRGAIEFDEKGYAVSVKFHMVSPKLNARSTVPLKHLRNLKELDVLSNRRFTDECLEHVQGLKKIERLRLPGAAVTGAGLVHLRNLAGLRVLVLIHTETTDEGLAHLSGLSALETLGVNPRVTDAGLVHLAELSNLKQLYLSDCPHITDEGMKHLSGLSHLEELHLFNTGVTDAGLIHLAILPKLKSLSLGKTKVTDAGLIHLVKLPNLSSLELGSTRVTDAGLRQLSEQRTLTRLILPRTKITGAGLVHLRALPSLESLDLSCTEIRDADLKHLWAFGRLTHLSLSFCPITDAGLPHLERLTNLEYLRLLVTTKITNQGLDRLRQALPKCEIPP